MLRYILSAIPLVSAAALYGQLTPQQRLDDFRSIVGIYNKQYAPYGFKLGLFGYDMLDVGSWTQRIETSRTDLEYYAILREYLASLQDGHAGYNIPSTFVASLPFTLDVYDDRPLIDSINRARLPAAEFPFQIGDELVAVDGQTAEQWERRLAVYYGTGNARATRRLAVGGISNLRQAEVAWAPAVPDVARIVIRRDGGSEESYEIPRLKAGTPLVALGPLPNPRGSTPNRRASDADSDLLRQLGNATVTTDRAVLGIAAVTPVFRLPDGFTVRIGNRPTDLYFTGTYQAGGLRIGFLRIPRFGVPTNTNEEAELARFIGEIVFMQQATDGIIIDVMRNPGGEVGILEGIAQTLMPRPFRTLGFEIRATLQWVNRFEEELQRARAANAPQSVIDRWARYLDSVRTAFAENRGNTGPLPLGSDTLDRLPFTLPDGTQLAYTKPIMVLTDEFSASGADMFPAVIRDNNRGILFGYRTRGAGGSVVTIPGGPYSEGTVHVTQTLMVRPDGRYIENHGVEPDVVNDFMTRENLITQGRPFVAAFTNVMVEHIRNSPQ